MSADQPATLNGRDPTSPKARLEAALKQLRIAKEDAEDEELSNRLDDALFHAYNAEMYLEEHDFGGGGA